MKVITKDEALENLGFYLKEMKLGKIFIFPTDTIYGIGCDATNSNSIKKVRLAKKRDDRPMSIIAPSMQWIRDNYILQEWSKKYLYNLPGKYTFILEYKENTKLSKEVNLQSNDTGVRIPNIWFSKVISKLGLPFIATSVNISGEPHVTKLENLDKNIENYVDYFIDEGELSGKPSKIYNLRTKECKKIR